MKQKTEKAEPKLPDENGMFKCSFCEKRYPKSVSLGGHVSKAHPGTSVNYSKKLAIRKSREVERSFLKKAK